MCYRWDGDQTASDQEYEDSEERNTEADLRLGQSLQRPSDGKSACFFLLSLVCSVMEVFKHVFIFKSVFIMTFIFSSGPHKASSVFNSATTQ